MRKFATLDCDGVLLNWASGFRSFLIEIEGLHVSPGVPCSYDMKRWTGISDDTVLFSLMDRFNAGEGGYFENLSPITGALEAVERLRQDGYTLSILTACNTDAKTKSGRLCNLEAVFGSLDVFENVDFVALTESKSAHLQARPAGIFVEDNLKNAKLGAQLGHRTILLDYPYNVDHEAPEGDQSYLRVRDWSHALDLVLERAPEELMQP